MSTIKLPSERHLEFHRRQWRLYLLYGGVLAIGTVVVVMLPGDNSEVVLVPAAVVFIVMWE